MNEYSPIWIHECTFYLYEHIRKTRPAWSWDLWSRSKSVSLSTGTPPTTERIISCKYATPTSNLGFEPVWVGSTTENLTIWARLSLRSSCTYSSLITESSTISSTFQQPFNLTELAPRKIEMCVHNIPMYLSKMELTKPHTLVVLIDVCVNKRSHIRAKWALKRENTQETAGMVSRHDGDTKNYIQTWG
jgi:hypothetical protein